jgi:hypothetical protein
VNGRIAIGGAIAQKPGCAGHAWQFLQYLLGFQRLGYEVLLLDRLPGDGAGAEAERSRRWLHAVMAEAGLERCWSLQIGGRTAGLERAAALRFVADADVLINVMGFITDPELLAAARLRAFLDTDPGFGQMWCALDLADVFAGHDALITIGQRIGARDCTVPTLGREWITTPQPVVLDSWPAREPSAGSRFTSIASWRGAYGPVDYEGRRYGLRVHELRRFAQLPRLAPGATFELALDIAPADATDAAMLAGSGWRLVTPATAVATPGAYRRYIQRSDAELMVAKGMYVQSRSGWISERSLCYLASGRPVLAQDTGFSERYPCGEGLVAFTTLEEAVAGVEAIGRAPARHAAAARDLAEAHFASDRVLGRLLDALGSRTMANRAARAVCA